MTEREAEPVATQLTPRQIVIAMSGLIIAMLLAQLDNMIVAPALPTTTARSRSSARPCSRSACGCSPP